MKPRWLLTLGLVTICATSWVHSQSTDEVNSVIQFNFSNPGARSLAMGGAFGARADDATAVYANPAGLTQLSRFEFALEGRGSRFRSPFVNSGVDAFGVGPVSAPEIGETETETGGASFASLMYPGSSDRWTIGGYRHAMVNYETEVFSDGVGDPGFPTAPRMRPTSAKYSLGIVAWGLSGAFKLYQNPDRTRAFSIGITAAYNDFDLASRTERLDSLRGTEGSSIATQDDPTVGITELDKRCCQFENRGDVRQFNTQTGSDNDVSFGAGILWKAKRYSLGAVYRQGPEFAFQANNYRRFAVIVGNLFTGFPVATREFVQAVGVPGPGPWSGVFKVPDVYGASFSVKPHKYVLISGDYNRVEYSDLLDTNLDVIGRDIGQGLAGPAQDFVLEDGDEYRLGIEGTIPWKTRSAWFLRAGAWSDPDHDMQYTGSDEELKLLFLSGDDEVHVSGGFGVRMPSFQIDMGVDLSERVDTVSVTGVFYFGAE